MAKSPKQKKNKTLQKTKPRTSQEPQITPPPSLTLQRDQALIQHYRFAGPIPPPELLAKYNEIIPNGADRILSMAEKQETHRQYLERAVIESDISQSKWGLIAGSLLTALAVGGGIYITALGHSAYGLAAILTPLTGLVYVFVYGQKQRKQERLERSRTRGEQPNMQKKKS